VLHLGSRFEAARQLKNAVLGEALRRLERMHIDPAYAVAKALPRGSTQPDATSLQRVHAQARREAFAALRSKHGFREFDLHTYSSLSATSWIRQHLDINTAQKVATRAFKSAERYSFGQAGRPRFARYGEVATVEGKSNTAGIRFRTVDGVDRILWSGSFGMLDLPLVVSPGDAVQAHGLRVALEGGVKYCRLLLRTIRGRKQAYVQLILQGQALRKGKHPVGSAKVGLDLGPSQVALVTEGYAEVMPFCAGLDRQEAAKRRYLRKLDRQRRANNPYNYQADGTVKPRDQRERWRSSQAMVRTRAALAEVLRALAAHRKSLQGALAHKVLAHGNRVRVEKVNKRAWAKLWGRSVGHKAPGMFQARVKALAEASGGFQEEVSTRVTYLSSRCLCGRRRKKALSERRHECGCACVPTGTWVDRDEFSAFLALHCREGLLDEQEAREAWNSWGVDILLHVSSGLQQAASGEAWPFPRGGEPRQSGSQRIGSSVREASGWSGGERRAEADVLKGALAPPGTPALQDGEDLCAQHGRDLGGGSPPVSWPQRANGKATA
jgi:hypothetical protein